jgi:hypothetical protein
MSTQNESPEALNRRISDLKNFIDSDVDIMHRLIVSDAKSCIEGIETNSHQSYADHMVLSAVKALVKCFDNQQEQLGETDPNVDATLNSEGFVYSTTAFDYLDDLVMTLVGKCRSNGRGLVKLLQEMDRKITEQALEDIVLKNYLDGEFDDRGFIRMVNAGR